MDVRTHACTPYIQAGYTDTHQEMDSITHTHCTLAVVLALCAGYRKSTYIHVYSIMHISHYSHLEKDFCPIHALTVHVHMHIINLIPYFLMKEETYFFLTMHVNI